MRQYHPALRKARGSAPLPTAGCSASRHPRGDGVPLLLNTIETPVSVAGGQSTAVEVLPLVDGTEPPVYGSETRRAELRLRLLRIEVLQHPASVTSGSGEPPVTQSLRLCRWLDAYDSFGDLATSYPRLDRDRFQVRIPDSVVPNDNKITIKLATKHAPGATDGEDNATEIECEKSNGYFISKPLILVGDDDDATWNQVGPGNNHLNDATHVASPGGKVEIEIPKLGNFKFEVPLAPYTDTITVETWVVRSPSSVARLPANLPTEINDSMKRAKEVYKQVHVKLNYTGPFDCMMTDAEIDEINKSYGASDPAGHMIIEGGNANYLDREAQTIFDKVVAAGAAGTDVVKIVFMDCETIQRSPNNTAWTVQDDGAKHGSFEGYIVIPYQHAKLKQQAAHEIGHAVRLDHPLDDGIQTWSYMLMYRHNVPNPTPFISKRFIPSDLSQMLASPRPPFIKPIAP